LGATKTLRKHIDNSSIYVVDTLANFKQHFGSIAIGVHHEFPSSLGFAAQPFERVLATIDSLAMFYGS
jgi:hypothetical protein